LEPQRPSFGLGLIRTLPFDFPALLCFSSPLFRPIRPASLAFKLLA
jgi:hypothetical protein